MIQKNKNSSNALSVWMRRLGIRSLVDETGVVGYIVRLLVLTISILFFVLPLLWLLIAPSKVESELYTLSPLDFGSVANLGKSINNLIFYFGNELLRWTLNSVYYTVGSIVLALVFTLPAGFALAFGQFKGKRVIQWFTMILMIMPSAALVLPMFLEMNLLGLNNTPWAVILPAAFYPFGVYLSYIFYASNLSKDVLDAARMDGCSDFQTFWHIGLPLSRTLLGLLIFMLFTGLWNNFYWPSLVLSSPKYFTIPMGVQNLSISTNAFRLGVPSSYAIHRPEGALIILFLALPVAIIFMISQRFVASGAMTGAVKE